MAAFSPVASKDVFGADRWDAEFFVNNYNDYLSSIFRKWPNWMALKDVGTKLTSGHTPLHHDVDTGDAIFITVECVNELAIDLQKAKKVWTSDILSELRRVELSPGDVLISIKRRIANSCPILDSCPMMAVNQDVAVLTPKPGFLPSYVAAVLVSRVGKFQALRHATEQMNPYISVTTLGALQIPVASEEFQRRVDKIVRARLEAWKNSVTLYCEAEKELLERMDWQSVAKAPEELYYVNALKTVTTAARMDAEHFQPKYTRLWHHLDKKGAQAVGEFCPMPRRGVQPAFVENGDVLVIDSKAVRPGELSPSADERTSREFLDDPRNAKANVGFGDVLLNSTGRGTLGRAACWLRREPAMADNHVAILRPDPKVCLPVYLALFLNSPPGLAQSEMFQTGSSGQLELYPIDVVKLRVFLPSNGNGKIDLKWQQRLMDKVLAASSAKAEAGAKLDEAKALVEREIEKRQGS